MSGEPPKSTRAKISKPTKATRIVDKAVSQADALAALNNIIDAGREYLTLHKEQSTRRAKIEAYRALESDKTQKAERALSNYFDLVFRERAGNFRELWARLDDAAEAGDDDTVREMLRGIVSLAQTSPLAGLVDDLPALRAAFDDPKHVWEF
jgi:uncharacterized membrane-anchored protein YjiN (DUF445 family)